MAALRAVVPALHSSYNEVNPHKRRILCLFDTPLDDFDASLQFFLTHMHEHPLITHYHQTRDGQAQKISDFLSQRQLANLGLYTECYRRVDTRYQISITLPTPSPLTVAFVLNRDRRDFSERDRLILNFLRPHLMQAYHNADMFSQLQKENAQLRQAIEESNRGVVVVKSNGRIRSMTERVRLWLETYCGRTPHAGKWLPLEVRGWFLRQQVDVTRIEALPSPRTPLVLKRQGKKLCVRLLNNARGNQDLLLLEEHLTCLTPESLKVLGVSRREAEVLY